MLWMTPTPSIAHGEKHCEVEITTLSGERYIINFSAVSYIRYQVTEHTVRLKTGEVIQAIGLKKTCY